jgi:hypothetical protein
LIWPPVSRPTDPESSREAETAINESGKRKSHAVTILEVVVVCPGLVTSVVCERSGLGQMEGRKRLSDLKAKGLVRAGPLAVYEETNRRQTTWFPVVAEEQLAMFPSSEQHGGE